MLNQPVKPKPFTRSNLSEIKSNQSREFYNNSIARCREYIKNGDAFQIVYSQRFTAEYDSDLFNAYRILRINNPSQYMVLMNVSLAVFNFIPVPPLDGSRILLVALPQRAYFGLMKYERYIMIALLAAVWFGALDTPLYYLNNIVWELLGKGTGYIDKIAYSIYYAGLGTVV